MLVLTNRNLLAVPIDGKQVAFNEILTSSDVKKIAKEDGVYFADVVEDLILIGIDDNGNNYYVNPG